MRRTCLVCEVMHDPFDEGIRIFAAELARALAVSQRQKMLLISEKDSEIDGLRIHGALGNRYFLSRRLAALIGSFGPEGVIYVPWTSLTPRSLLRIASLRRYARGARLAAVALQPRPADLAARVMARMGRPDIVLAAGPAAEAQAARLGIRSARIAPGVDLQRFRPASASRRAELKRRAGLEPGAFVVLHVGHMKESRNIGVLEELARLDKVAAVLVASSSTAAEAGLAARLSAAGVILMTRHQDRIESAYHLADAYLFPVTSGLDAIEVPLSVLEAAACDLAIVSTPYGGLPDLFPEGVHWAGTPQEMIVVVRRLAAAARAEGDSPGTRRLVERLGWDRAASQVMSALQGST